MDPLKTRGIIKQNKAQQTGICMFRGIYFNVPTSLLSDVIGDVIHINFMNVNENTVLFELFYNSNPMVFSLTMT